MTSPNARIAAPGTKTPLPAPVALTPAEIAAVAGGLAAQFAAKQATLPQLIAGGGRGGTMGIIPIEPIARF